MAKKTINVQGVEINLVRKKAGDYICLTDMARNFDGAPKDHIRNWLRNGSTIEFLGVWEKVHNADFKVVEFHHLKSQFTKKGAKWLNGFPSRRVHVRSENHSAI